MNNDGRSVFNVISTSVKYKIRGFNGLHADCELHDRLPKLYSARLQLESAVYAVSYTTEHILKRSDFG